ncbi:hypothetical protein D3C71_2166360 [compost metagenome]
MVEECCHVPEAMTFVQNGWCKAVCTRLGRDVHTLNAAKVAFNGQGIGFAIPQTNNYAGPDISFAIGRTTKGQSLQ